MSTPANHSAVRPSTTARTGTSDSDSVVAARQWAALDAVTVEPKEIAVVIELERVSRLHQRSISESLTPFVHRGIRNIEDFRLLALLRRNPDVDGFRMTDIADTLQLSRASISQRIDRLTGAGLVERSAMSGDARVVRISLADGSHTVIDEALVAVVGSTTDLLSDLAHDELDALRLLLERAKRKNLDVDPENLPISSSSQVLR